MAFRQFGLSERHYLYPNKILDVLNTVYMKQVLLIVLMWKIKMIKEKDNEHNVYYFKVN